jgi:hypothetical protein
MNAEKISDPYVMVSLQAHLMSCHSYSWRGSLFVKISQILIIDVLCKSNAVTYKQCIPMSTPCLNIQIYHISRKLPRTAPTPCSPLIHSHPCHGIATEETSETSRFLLFGTGAEQVPSLGSILYIISSLLKHMMFIISLRDLESKATASKSVTEYSKS